MSGFGFAWNVKKKILRDLLLFLHHGPLRAKLHSYPETFLSFEVGTSLAPGCLQVMVFFSFQEMNL